MKMRLPEVSPEWSPEVADIKPSKVIVSGERSRSCCRHNDNKLRSMKSSNRKFETNRRLFASGCHSTRATTLRTSLVCVLVVLQILLVRNPITISEQAVLNSAEGSLGVVPSAGSSQQPRQSRLADAQEVGASSVGADADQVGAAVGSSRANTEPRGDEGDDAGDSAGQNNAEDGSPSRQSAEAGGRPRSERRPSEGSLKNKMKTLDEFLESLPTLSVGQKHTARFECELNKETAAAAPGSPSKSAPTQLVWVKLTRRAELSAAASAGPGSSALAAALQAQQEHDTKVISLNQKLITPDKRFKVRRQSPIKWILSIDDVGPDDNHAYYLCQSAQQVNAAAGKLRASKQQATTDDSPGRKFVGGARLNVLVPPKIVEQETSPSLVQANEFEQLSLKCKVISEPQSQLMWKREDGRSLDGLEQRFRHEFERRPSQIVSIDSSELVFSSITRQNAGAYLCIASNGVQPGVSQRVSVGVAKCRAGPEPSAAPEPCEQPEEPSQSAATAVESTTATATIQAKTRSWKTTKQTFGESQRRQLQQQQRLLPADKRRANADHNSINRNGSDAKDSAPFWPYLCALLTTLAVARTLVAFP